MEICPEQMTGTQLSVSPQHWRTHSLSTLQQFLIWVKCIMVVTCMLEETDPEIKWNQCHFMWLRTKIAICYCLHGFMGLSASHDALSRKILIAGPRIWLEGTGYSRFTEAKKLWVCLDWSPLGNPWKSVGFMMEERWDLSVVIIKLILLYVTLCIAACIFCSKCSCWFVISEVCTQWKNEYFPPEPSLISHMSCAIKVW